MNYYTYRGNSTDKVARYLRHRYKRMYYGSGHWTGSGMTARYRDRFRGSGLVFVVYVRRGRLYKQCMLITKKRFTKHGLALPGHDVISWEVL